VVIAHDPVAFANAIRMSPLGDKGIKGAALKNSAPAAGYRRPGYSQGLRAFRLRSINVRRYAWCQRANASGLGAKAPEANGSGSGFVVDDPPRADCGCSP
jgi:hypothetical protein